MSARSEALRVLGDVLAKGAYLNLALKKVHLEPDEQRFMTALVSTTLENLQGIDYVLGQFIRPARTNPKVLNILRLGAAQILHMAVPDSAAVNESVKLAGKANPKLKGLVNATLRNVAAQKDKIPYPNPEDDYAGHLSIRYGYPRWICELFVDQRGRETAEALLASRSPHEYTCLRLTDRFDPADRAPDWKSGRYLDDAAYVPHVSGLGNDPLFESGAVTAQGESSMLCVRALGLPEDARVLDLCAAPGGKSAYAAQIACQGEVVACDIHDHRVRLIEQTARRLGRDNLLAMQWDATRPNPQWQQAFEHVLVDAPCSALGLLYRKPDIRATKKPEDLLALAETQRSILDQAARYVRPGGVLVYCTCTIDRLENENNAEWFLDTHPDFQDGNIAECVPQLLRDKVEGSGIQLLPDRDGVDGFYIARFHRKEDHAMV